MPADDSDLSAVLDAIVATIPPPEGDPKAPLQAIVTNLDASDYLGRLGIGRVVQGTLRAGETVALCHSVEEEPPTRRRLTQLLGFEGLDRNEVEERLAGDLFVVAGFPSVEIGDTFADADNPVPLPRLSVDEPVLKMFFGVNTSPLAGRDGTQLTSRQIKDRLDKEVRGNVSIRVGATTSPDVIEVAGRGELQLAVLIETMRREGFELQVSRPEVIIKMVDGVPHEPIERAVIDIPTEHVGTVTQSISTRKGLVTDMALGDAGRTIVTVTAPARGLIGLRSLLMTTTRGTALVHQHHDGWQPWAGDLPPRVGGAMAADRLGTSTGFALDNLQQRGELFIGLGEEVYEGMIIGEASRPEEMHVNATKAKELNNIRTHNHDEAVKLAPPRRQTLETAIEWIADDELVEVTPTAIRIRKRHLSESERRIARKKKV
jgi:GTP-binding protein